MTLYFILMSGFLAAMQNLCMRRSVDTGGSTNIYVPIQLFISFLIAIVLNPVRLSDFGVNVPIIFLGLGMGVILGFMMSFLGKSLKWGTPALTFAVLNSCSVLPSVLMAFLFGKQFNHPYHWWNGMGSCIVIIGIFWSSWAAISCRNKFKWIFFIGLSSIAFVLFSAMTQWRILLESHGGASPLLPFKISPLHNAWFMPAIFLGATLIQLFNVKSEPNLRFSLSTLIYGLLGGVANGSSMFFMILSTEKASPFENALIFPLFSITVIQITNLWGRQLYKEKINWAPQMLCVAGLILGSVYWPEIFG
ncbi:MAG: hypothetical protein WDZ28_05085 [Simkaniaceae bacterium]